MHLNKTFQEIIKKSEMGIYITELLGHKDGKVSLKILSIYQKLCLLTWLKNKLVIHPSIKNA